MPLRGNGQGRGHGLLWMVPLSPREAAGRQDSHCVECVFCQEPVQLGKGRPLLRLPAPAPKHQLIQAQGAGRWPGQVHLHFGSRWRKARDRCA